MKKFNVSRELLKKYYRKIYENNGVMHMTLPRKLGRAMNITEGDTLRISHKDGKFIMEKVK